MLSIDGLSKSLYNLRDSVISTSDVCMTMQHAHAVYKASHEDGDRVQCNKLRAYEINSSETTPYFTSMNHPDIN
jgi:hypothetical protein